MIALFAGFLHFLPDSCTFGWILAPQFGPQSLCWAPIWAPIHILGPNLGPNLIMGPLGPLFIYLGAPGAHIYLFWGPWGAPIIYLFMGPKGPCGLLGPLAGEGPEGQRAQ